MKATVRDVVRTRARQAGIGALALVLLAPALRAQDSTSARPAGAPPAVGATGAATRTHTVRPGETLFDLAQRYLGDGDLWPEIYRLNAGVIEDPHWIYANEVLRIPATDNASASAVATGQPTVTEAAAAPAAPAAPMATPAATADAMPAPGQAAEEPAPTANATLFSRTTAGRAMFSSTRSGPSALRGRPGIHPDEHFAAPYVDRDGGPRGAGVVAGTTDESNVINAHERAHYDIDDEVYITMPAGSSPSVGDRFYTYRLGISFGDRGQMVIPTAILTVQQPGAGTDATIARVTTLFGELHLGERVMALDAPQLPTAKPTRVEDGTRTRVLWVEDQVVLPTIQYYVVLDASEKQGVHLGDQVTLYRPRVHLPESAVTLPESEIAIAEVVRVNEYSATALVVSQTQPAIEAGIAARVTARMP
jgi:LysM repeat protein